MGQDFLMCKNLRWSTARTRPDPQIDYICSVVRTETESTIKPQYRATVNAFRGNSEQTFKLRIKWQKSRSETSGHRTESLLHKYHQILGLEAQMCCGPSCPLIVWTCQCMWSVCSKCWQSNLTYCPFKQQTFVFVLAEVKTQRKRALCNATAAAHVCTQTRRSAGGITRQTHRHYTGEFASHSGDRSAARGM